MRVYKGKYGYSVLCKNKNENEDIKCYLSVGFRKGQEPLGDSTDIIVKNFFFTCYKKQDGSVQPKLFIMDYDLDEEVVVNDEGVKEVKPSTDLFITEEELPFY